MKKALSVLLMCAAYITGIEPSTAAVRDGSTTSRTNTNQTTQRVSNTTNTARTASDKTTVLRTTTSRSSTAAKRQATARSAAPQTQVRTPTTSKNTVTARAATTPASTTQTRTGAEYERCKTAFFTCMDQFCQLKNDDYRRCSCSDRVYEFDELRDTLQQASQELTAFTENLDVVGMTAAQATAMRTASEGENALTEDTSASKALLQAIMNSIRGEDSSVGGKYSDLNSINISFDTVNAFGASDAGQAIAAYNGQTLYSAVYPSCRAAVRDDCNDASLQRAITAYLMAIEQDCNTVQTAIEESQKQLKSAVRESSALLDLARVENRQKHNSNDITTCVNEVEAAILSEQVCGENYHKCLDNGEFIDVTTGAPIAGVERFYELEQMLTFTSGVDAASQKLAQNTANRAFVQNFENKTKKFAADALDKCTEQADTVWQEYLDKAMLSIYYAQKAKVSEIKQGCFDFVSSCYMNSETGLTDAMKELTGDTTIILQPDNINLSTEMCRDYINSCDLMFDDKIVAEYVNNRNDEDTITACRAIAKQCFDKYGGTNYENFYYPYSGLFNTGQALDWFTLKEYSVDAATGTLVPHGSGDEYISRCAQQLADISSCKDPETIKKVFGGFDRIVAKATSTSPTVTYIATTLNSTETGLYDGKSAGKHKKYGTLPDTATNGKYVLEHHVPRPTGVATEIYNQIVDSLTTQCTNIQGRFIELQYVRYDSYQEDNLCVSTFDSNSSYGGKNGVPSLATLYNIGLNENMCPREYDLSVDTQSWGACLCWENGGRRSKWGKSPKCVAGFPTAQEAKDSTCPDYSTTTSSIFTDSSSAHTVDNWCTVPNKLISSDNQVCTVKGSRGDNDEGCKSNGKTLYNLPDGLGY